VLFGVADAASEGCLAPSEPGRVWPGGERASRQRRVGRRHVVAGGREVVGAVGMKERGEVLQLPSAGAGGEAVSGGQPEFIPLLSRAAVAAGVDGVFMEVHDNPAQAKSDGANALDLKNLERLLGELLAIRKVLP